MTRISLKSLSSKLLLAVILAGIAIGGVLSSMQIIVDAGSARKNLINKAQQILTMMKTPASQASYYIDATMAQRVLSGLFENNSVYYAAITIPGEPPLAEKTIARTKHKLNRLIDSIFGSAWTFSIPLEGDAPWLAHSSNTHRTFNTLLAERYGELTISIDPNYEGQLFLERAGFILLFGILQALIFSAVFYFICRILLTQPLKKLINSLRFVDPNHPAKFKLPTPMGHAHDEIGHWIELVNSLLNSIETNSHQREHAEAQAEHYSNYDLLTELPNRNLFETRLERVLREAGEKNKMLAVLCFSLDDFKSVNQLHSYRKGDKLLAAVATRLRYELDFVHTLSRLGGDEFAIITEELQQHYDAATLAQQVLDTISRPYQIDGDTIEVRATIGISVFPTDGNVAELILKNSENVMRLAKSQGGNRYQFYVASVDTKIRERRALEKDLSHALEQNDLFLVYQAQMDLGNNRVQSAEALLRWLHPTRGLIPSTEFIQLAEESDLIIPIGTWVLETACAEIKRWHELGFGHIGIAVNISPVQIRQENFVRLIEGLLDKYQINPARLELEITETAIMANVEHTINTLESLKAMGLQLAIDDFGTGYSSLSYLKRLPFDRVKIDREFIHDVLDDPNDATIVRAIIHLTQSLNLRVIAEGVETLEQQSYLTQHGCVEGQGYYYSKPIPADEFIHFLTSNLELATNNQAAKSFKKKLKGTDTSPGKGVSKAFGELHNKPIYRL